MWGARVLFNLLLLPSLVLYNQGIGEINRDCRFITCRDCTVSRCVWAIYFNGDENCVESTKALPGVEAECDDPSQCGKPKCVMPAHNSWDATGIAQLLGGIFGGILAGMCGGVGIQSWRRGRRAGYVEIGGQNRTWRDFFQAFLCAFADGLGRRDDGAPLRGDDEADEQQRQEAAGRNAQRQMDGERLDQNQEELRNEEDDAAVNVNIDPPPPAQNNRQLPQENQQLPQENQQPNEQQQQNLARLSFEIHQPGLGMQFGPNERPENENISGVGALAQVNLNLEDAVVVVDDEDDGTENDGINADGDDEQNDGFGAAEDDEDNDEIGAVEDDEENDGNNDTGSNNSDSEDQTLGAPEIDSDDDNVDDDWREPDAGAVAQGNIVPKSSRAASVSAAKLIASLRVNKQI